MNRPASSHTAQLTDLRARSYIACMRAFKRYHRHTIDGLEHLLTPGGKIIVGYHGRGLPTDLGMLSLEVLDRQGYLPRSVMHAGLWKMPVVRHLVDHWGGIAGDMPSLRRALEGGELVIITPGGTQEGLRTWRERYVVDWARRRGYLKLALELDVPLVPIASAGVDDRFIGLNDGHVCGKRLGLPFHWPCWIALGLNGIYPFTLPLPVQVHTVVGAPIRLRELCPGDPDDPAWLETLHREVTGRVQALLDQARGRQKG